MDIEEHVEATEASPNDDLRSALESAVRESSPREEHHADPAADAPAPKTAVERARDASGKFAPKPADEPAAAAKEPDATQQTQEGTAPAATRKAPAGWSPENQQAFSALPPAIQDQILKRETDVAKGFDERAQKVRAADEWDRVAAPYAPVFQKLGLTPHQAAERMFLVEQQLQRDPVGTVLRIAQAYGVRLPGTPQQAATQQRQAPQPPAVPIDHVVEQKVQAVLQRQATQSEISKFAADPANPHFEALRPNMQLLLQAGKASSLREAYDAAAWLDPTIREQILAQRAAPAAAQAQTAKDQAAVARAKSAAASVRGAPGGAVTPAPTSKGSLRADLEWAAHQHRA